MRVFSIILALSFVGLSNSEARVFNFDTQTFSTYLRATGGTCNLQREAYQPGLPSSISFSDNNLVNSAYSAEFGLAFTKPSFTTRVGVELLYPNSASGSTGTNSSGAALLTLTNQTYSIIPQANFEIFLKKKPNYRIYFGLGAGYAITVFKNTVTMTAQGTATYPAVQNYIEEATGSGIMGQGYFGIEFPAFDNVSLSLDAGYRYLVATNYTSNRSFTSPIGSFQMGSAIMNADGSSRTTDLSGAFAALSFRFYFY